MGRGRLLECNCCGESAGRWRQWWNRDTGYGICPRCAGEQSVDMAELRRNCGEPGINYDAGLIPVERLLGEIARLATERARLGEAAKRVRGISAEMTGSGRESALGLRLYEVVEPALTFAGFPTWEEEKEREAFVRKL